MADTLGKEAKEVKVVNNNSNLEKAIIAILFFPTLVGAVATYYFGFFKWRLKPSVIFAFSLPVVLLTLTAFYFVFLNSFFQSGDYFGIFGSIISDPLSWFTGLLILLLSFGLILGAYYAGKTKRSLDINRNRTLNVSDYFYGWKGVRRGPIQELRRRQIVKMLSKGALNDGEKIALGITEDNEILFVYDDELRKPLAIFGASGSGKTVTLLSMIKRDIEFGIPVVIIDMKGGRELASKVSKWASEAGSNFYHFVQGDEYSIRDSLGQASYDPLATSKKLGNTGDILLGLREWNTNSDFYKSALKGLIQLVIEMFRETNFEDPFIYLGEGEKKSWQTDLSFIDFKNGELFKIGSAVDEKNFEKFAQAILFLHSQEIEEGGVISVNDVIEIDTPGGIAYNTVKREIPVSTWRSHEVASRVEDFIRKAQLDKPYGKSEERNALNALQRMLSTLASSTYGKWLKTSSSRRVINLERILSDKSEGNVVLFSLNSDAEADFVRHFSTLLISDISSVSASRRNREGINGENRISRVYIDEFQAVSAEALSPLLEKARQSAISIVISAQSPEQIVTSSKSNGEAYKKAIFDNCSNFFIHNGMSEESAIDVAKVVGQEEFLIPSSKLNGRKYFKLIQEIFNPVDDSKARLVPIKDWVIKPKQIINIPSPKHDGSRPAGMLCLKKSSQNEREIEYKFIDVIVPSEDIIKSVSGSGRANPISREEKEKRDDSTSLKEVGVVPTNLSYEPKEIEEDWFIEEVDKEEEDDFEPVLVEPEFNLNEALKEDEKKDESIDNLNFLELDSFFKPVEDKDKDEPVNKKSLKDEIDSLFL